MMNCVNSQHIYLIFTTWLSWFLRQRSISGFDIWDKEEMLTLGLWVLPTTGRASFFGVFIASESLLCCIILHCDVVYNCLGIFVWCSLCESLSDCITFYTVLYCIVWESLLCHIILNHYFIIIQWLYYYCITLYCIVLPGSLYWSSSEKLAWHGNLALESALNKLFHYLDRIALLPTSKLHFYRFHDVSRINATIAINK